MEIQFYTPKGIAVFISLFVKGSQKKVARFLSLSTLLMFICFIGLGQTTPITFSQIPLSDPDDAYAPGRAGNEWNFQNTINIPLQGTNTTRSDSYFRFTWSQIQPTGGSQGVYDFTFFDHAIQQAMDNGQSFSFGVMQQCGGCDASYQANVGGGVMMYPVWLHNQMQAENPKDYLTGGMWWPNYNSPSYLAAWKALHAAINNHILTTTYKGVRYQDVIFQIDTRGYGDYGEWTENDFSGPAGTQATAASLESIISAVVHGYETFQVCALMATFDGNQLGNTMIPPEVGYYALTTSNTHGKLGWRRDNWGWTDNYNNWWTDKNPTVYNGMRFDTAIMNRYKYAPILGEPADGGAAGDFSSLVTQVPFYHVNSFGNGNFTGSQTQTTVQNNIRAASKAAGYRLILESGNMSTTLSAGSPFSILLNWKNIGVAPTYEDWNVIYELRNSSNAVVWSGTSSFNPKLFLPSGTATGISDNFTLPGTVPQGTYGMYLIIKDPNAYRKPLPIAITGRNADGSYLLRSNITVGTGGPVNQLPTANAGADQTIQLPVSSVSLAGSGADADGSVASYAWTKLSGPAGATISTPTTAGTSITGLVQGVYVYTLTVTDNQGGTGTDNVQITVNAAAANIIPTANAGADQTIQLPVSSVSLTGAGADADGSVASYAWTKLSGPAGATISTPTTAGTSITGLVQGVYVYTLTVTDNQGGTGTDNVQITVNAAIAATPANMTPVAKAGSDMNITLPTNSVSVNGTASADPDGTITSYTWTKVAGPTQYTIGSSIAASTTITNLAAGTYSFQLKVMDNAGAVAMDTVNVTVNPAAPANQPPVANAGADQNITLPVNSVTINGNASSDPDGSIASYLWTKVSGPAQFTIGNNGAASTLLSNLAAGVYSFQLKVTDNSGAIAQDTVKIIVNTALVNQPPVANAGADNTIVLPVNTTTLNGSASSDADGTISSYTWTQASGPNSATVASAGNASTSISGLLQGVYIFTLKVTDNSGASDLDSVRVTVNPAVNQPPVANAGSSTTITLPVNSTSLNGSLSSDPDGSIVSYSWAQIAGPSTSTITGGSSAIATAANLVAGLYTFELTVADNSGAVSKANVKISVVASSIQPPVANAGSDQTITLPTNSVTIDGSSSSASSGTITSYVWTEKSGPSTVSLANTAQNTLNNLQAGVYVFSLSVTDNNSATDTDSVRITVNSAVNTAPVADAGSSINLTLPTNSTTLDGSKSYDPDGTINTYNWVIISGTNTPVMNGANTPSLSVSGLVKGQYTYQLTVTDNRGASSSAQIKIKVSAAANTPPTARAGASKNLTAPTSTTTLDGSASTDPDGTITSYSWVTVSGPGSTTINNSNTATPTVEGLQTGTYVFELTVTDNQGAVSQDQTYITVMPQAIIPNQMPVANAGADQTITLPTNTTVLDGNSSFDPDGTLTGYSWKQISGPSTASITPGNISTSTASGLIEGQYVFELTVTDNNGKTIADQVTVNVNAGVAKLNMPPVAVAGADVTITLPNDTYTLDATQSMDPDGTIDSYQWLQVSGPNTVTSVSMNNAQVTVSNLVVGEYEFQVTATDNSGASSTSSMKLTVVQGTSHGFTQLNRLSVYPNPAHSIVNQRITSDITGTVQINVYDMNGKMVYTAQEEKTSDVLFNKIVISQLGPGMYTIQVNIANQQTLVSKFIKY